MISIKELINQESQLQIKYLNNKLTGNTERKNGYFNCNCYKVKHILQKNKMMDIILPINIKQKIEHIKKNNGNYMLNETIYQEEDLKISNMNQIELIPISIFQFSEKFEPIKINLRNKIFDINNIKTEWKEVEKNRYVNIQASYSFSVDIKKKNKTILNLYIKKAYINNHQDESIYIVSKDTLDKNILKFKNKNYLTINPIETEKIIDEKEKKIILEINLYKEIEKEVFSIKTNIEKCNDLIKIFKENISKKNIEQSIKIISSIDNIIYKSKEFIESKKINEIYKKIFETLNEENEIIKETIISSSYRITILQKLEELKNIDFIKLKEDYDIKKKYMNDKIFSNEQKDIITENKPLINITAGAGTGKSYTLINKIKYLDESKNDLTKFRVLSFTNIASKNIKNKFPSIKSITTTTFIKNIFEQNKIVNEDVQISAITTFLNKIKLNYKFNDDKKDINKLISYLEKIEKNNVSNIYYSLSKNIIKNNMKLIIDIINNIGIIPIEMIQFITLIYLENSLLDVNDEIDYIMIDEAQDLSALEYLIILSIVKIKKSNITIVGDPNQTLYQFRNASPETFNAIELSDIFTKKKLTINFRSNNQILKLANKYLDNINVNISKIKLLPNFLEKNEKFSEKVELKEYIDSDIKNRKSYLEKIEEIFETDHILNYIYDKLDKEENISILTFTNSEAITIEKKLKQLLPFEKDKIINTSNKKIKNAIISSNLLKQKIILQSSKNGATPENNNKFIKNNLLEKIKNKKIKNAIKKIPIDSLDFDEDLLQVEINKTNQDVIENKFKKEKKDTKIIISTIHSAKGKEFDNVIFVSNNTNNQIETDEEKRIKLVALTRAKRTELILEITSKHKINSIREKYESCII